MYTTRVVCGTCMFVVIMLFSLISRMLISIFQSMMFSIIIFCFTIWQNVLYQWKVLPLGLITASRVFTALTKPILFLYHHKDFHFVICRDDIMVLVCSKWLARGHIHFCVLYWFTFDYILIFQNVTCASLRLF